MPHVLLLFNTPVLPDDHPDADSERAMLSTCDAVQAGLIQAKYTVRRLGLVRDPEPLIEEVRRQRPDVVFNLFEGFGDYPQSEYHIAGLLDWLKIPFTGCSVESMVFGRDKVRTKYLLQGAGLPTAEFLVVDRLPLARLPAVWPVMVKPAGTDASVGIDQQSVVADRQALEQRISFLLERYDPPVLVETYLSGTEFNVGVLEFPEMHALPVAEMVYSPQAGVDWPIVTYASKWHTGCAEDLAMQPRCPAQIDAKLAVQLQSIALAAFRLVGCRDYARIDLRLDGDGRPHILEVNPNPDIDPAAGLARMLKVAGWTYERFVVELVRQALQRHASTPTSG